MVTISQFLSVATVSVDNQSINPLLPVNVTVLEHRFENTASLNMHCTARIFASSGKAARDNKHNNNNNNNNTPEFDTVMPTETLSSSGNILTN
jgi:hypothetical protein